MKSEDPTKLITGLINFIRFAYSPEEKTKESKEGDTIVIPGKVLSQGELTKRIKIVAFSFSERAKEKLLSSKCGVSTIKDEIKKNPKAEGIRIVK